MLEKATLQLEVHYPVDMIRNNYKAPLLPLQSDHSQYRDSDDLMELLLYKKKALYLRKSASGFLYSRLCAHIKSSSSIAPNSAFFARLLRCPENEIAEMLLLNDRAGRIKDLAKQLYDGGFIMDASALLISSQTFHPELSTLNDALIYATKLFKR